MYEIPLNQPLFQKAGWFSAFKNRADIHNSFWLNYFMIDMMSNIYQLLFFNLTFTKNS